MNSFELSRVNNYLTFLEGVFKAAYVLTDKKREELYQEGFLSSSNPLATKQMNTVDKPMSEKAVERFKAKGFKVVEFNRYLQPELSAAIKQQHINAVVCKDSKTGNLMVCYDPRESAKMRTLENSLYNDCKNFQTDMKTLKNINATVENAKIRPLKRLSDFQYHVLCEKLPQYKVAFVGTIARDGAHSISFSSVDDKKVMQCVKDAAGYMCTPEGAELSKKIQREKKIFKDIEKSIKNNETLYVASSQYGKFLKIEPNKFTVLEEKADGRIVPMASKNNPIEGNVFKESTWLNISQNVVEMNNPAVLSEEEFNKFAQLNLDERDSVIDAKVEEMEADIKSDENRTPDEIIKDLSSELNFANEERTSLDELE